MMGRVLRKARQVLNPRNFNFNAQRHILHPDRRASIARMVASHRPATTAARTPDNDPAIRQLVLDMDQQSFHLLPGVVTPQMAAEMREYFAGCMVSDPYRPELGKFNPVGDQVPKPTHVAFHDGADVIKCPHALAIANDPYILAGMEALLGCKPTLGYLTAWWSMPVEGEAAQAENFHRDVDDWAFFKVFVYLTDVDEGTGPHVLIPGSHSKPDLLPIRRYTEEEVAVLGPEKHFTGPAGSAFIENTYGMHRGLPARTQRRAIFQAVYSLSPLPYAPAKPYPASQALVPPGIDPWVNRLYLDFTR